MRIHALVSIVMLASMGGSIALAQTRSRPVNGNGDNSHVISKINAGLYNLQSNGLASFTAKVTTDWALLLGTTPDPDVTKLLNDNWLTVSDDGNKVMIEVFPGPLSAQNNEVKGAFDGVRTGLNSFFQTWNRFAMSRPVPENGVQISHQGTETILKWKEGSNDLELRTDRDFVIRRLMIVGPALSTAVVPQFVKDSKGLRLVHYTEVFVPKEGFVNNRLDVSIDYQPIANNLLIKHLYFESVYQDQKANMAFDFSDFRVTPN